MKLLIINLLLFAPAIIFSQINLEPLDVSVMPVLNDQVFKQVEVQPLFPGCEDVEDEIEKKSCSDLKMLQFIYANIEYPKKARREEVEGMVVVKFIVEKDGSITNAEVIRDIGAGCGLESLRVVMLMPNWTPGKQDGQPVRVQFNLPVKFKLEDPQPPPNSPPGQNFSMVDEQPGFPGCEHLLDKKEIKSCSESKLLDFINSHIKYPTDARKNGVEGMVVVKFVVEIDGSLTNAEIAQDIGDGCGQEALRIVSLMPKWTPGKMNGMPVRVQFNLPFLFKLEGKQLLSSSPPRQALDNGYRSPSYSQPTGPPRQALDNKFPFLDGIYTSYVDFIRNEPAYYPDDLVYIGAKEDAGGVMHLSSIEKLGRNGKSSKIFFDRIWGVCINQQPFILHKKGKNSASLYPIKVIGNICHFSAETSFSIKNLNTGRTMLNSYSARQYILNLQNGNIEPFTEKNLETFIGDDFQLHQEFTSDPERGQKLFIYLIKYNERNPFY